MPRNEVYGDVGLLGRGPDGDDQRLAVDANGAAFERPIAFYEQALIAPAGTLTGEVVIGHARIVNIEVGLATSAKLSFQAQAKKGGEFFDVYDDLGVEVQFVASTHNRIYSVPGLSGMYAVKIRSGVSGSTTAQTSGLAMAVFGTY